MSVDVIDHEVVVIGAGFSGIGVAVGLDRSGIHDYLIVEAGDGFGGTWNWNRYPGIAVDIPSFSYQYSFEKRTDWSRVYAPGEELRAYAEHCADKYGLRGRTRFGTRVDGAAFDADGHAWHLRTSTADELVARHVVDATGVLTVPKRPDIAGVQGFAGLTMHTARWDGSQDLRGKRVAVVGTGASAVQLVPAIAPEVEHMTVFQRTPIWCLPKYDAALSPRVRRALERAPGAKHAARVVSQTLVELTFPLPAHYHRRLPAARFFEKQARAFLEQQVRDPVVREKLTPNYPLGCKRPGFHNEYLATFNRDDVVLETAPIARVEADAVVTEDGTRHEADVLILATGFKVFDPGNMPAYPVTGVGGLDLEEFWTEHRFQAYEGVSVPGFPNYFTVFGPYAYNGSSYFNLVETQARHIVRCLSHARASGATYVEVTREANDRYFAEMLRRRGDQVFWQPGCRQANSYYFEPRHGDVPLKPMPTLETVWRARRFPLRDYRFERLAPVAAASYASG
jgi:cation diffusion facilitator CzcD-associated flavoprotein CzcO